MAIYACELPPAQQRAVSKKKVVLWGHENLLGYSVEFLLNTRGCLELVKISEQLGIQVLIDQVETLCPDVVIIDQMNSFANSNLPMLLMKNQVWMKVILVNLENNSVEVFSKQLVQINEGSDLLSIVEGCPRLPCLID